MHPSKYLFPAMKLPELICPEVEILKNGPGTTWSLSRAVRWYQNRGNRSRNGGGVAWQRMWSKKTIPFLVDHLRWATKVNTILASPRTSQQCFLQGGRPRSSVASLLAWSQCKLGIIVSFRRELNLRPPGINPTHYPLGYWALDINKMFVWACNVSWLLNVGPEKSYAIVFFHPMSKQW